MSFTTLALASETLLGESAPRAPSNVLPAVLPTLPMTRPPDGVEGVEEAGVETAEVGVVGVNGGGGDDVGVVGIATLRLEFVGVVGEEPPFVIVGEGRLGVEFDP